MELSDLPFYRFVPKEPMANAEFRLRLLEWADAKDVNDSVERLDQRVKRRSAIIHACKKDPLFFCNVFCWIAEPRSVLGKVPWITWQFQDEATMAFVTAINRGWEKREETDFINAKSRDMGGTWLCVEVMLWYGIFHKYFSALMLSRVQAMVDSSDEQSIFSRVDFLLANLPSWMRPRDYRAKNMWQNLDNQCYLKGDATQEFSGVGNRTTVILVDELSVMKDQAAIWQNTRAVAACRIANFTMKRYASTANKLVEKAKRGEDGLGYYEMHWTKNPRCTAGLYKSNDGELEILDPNYEFPKNYKFRLDGKLRSIWYDRQEDRCATADEMASEVDMLPLPPGGLVFEPAVIQACIASAPPVISRGDVFLSEFDTPVFLEATDGPLRIWHQLSDGLPPYKDYVIGADVSGGTGASYSVMSVWEKYTGRKVAEWYSNRIDPIRMAHSAAALCQWYLGPAGVAYMKPEVNGPTGVQFVRELTTKLKFMNVYMNVDERNLAKKSSTTPGWWSKGLEKGALMRTYALALKTKRAINPSIEGLQECTKYTYDSNGVPIHVDLEIGDDDTINEGSHGDIPIADMLGFSACELPSISASVDPIEEQTDLRSPQAILAMFEKRDRMQRRQPYWMQDRYTRRWKSSSVGWRQRWN